MLFASKQKKRYQQNGIDINNAPQQQKSSTIIAAICSQVLLILFAVFGVTYSFIGSFGLNVQPITIGVYILLFVVVFVFAFTVKKWTKFILPSVLLLFCLAVWYFYNDLMQGFILITNSILASFTAHSDWVFTVYAVKPATAQQYVQMATVFLLFVLFAVTGIVSSAVIRSKSFFSVFFITFPFILAALVFTITPPLLPLLLLSTCWIALAVQRISTRKIKEVKKSRKKADLSETQSDETTHQLNYFSMVAVALCFALILCIFPQSSYVRDSNANIMRDNLKNFVNKSNLLSPWQTGGINGGNLKSSGDLTFSGETALRIKTDNKDSLYLRAFAGSTYTGDRWEPISDKIYNEYSATFSTLSGKSINPLNLTEKIIGISYSPMSEVSLGAQYTITVQNVHANKHYVYAPYALITTPAELPGAVFVNDGYIKTDSWLGLSSYSLRANYPYSVSSFSNFTIEADKNIRDYYKAAYQDVEKQTESVQEYLKVEQAYRNFLYDYNTALPDDIKKKAIKLCADNQLSKDNLNDEINAVQAYLAKTCQYTLSPGKTPANRDFTDYFLFENHKGYCVHFATAATILLRAMGIPARYVEGYVANENDLATLDSDGYASIKDSRAHAWTEVYVPTYGWVPVEMTPGFCKTNGSLSAKAGDEPAISSQKEESNSESSTPESDAESEAAQESQPSSMPESSTPSSSLSGSIGGKDDNTDILISDITAALVPILFLLLLLITLLAVLYGNRKYAIRWRKQNFHLQDTNKSARAIYNYILKIFAFYGYKYKHDIPMQEFAKRAVYDLWILRANEFLDITQIAQKACFSQHKVTEKELAAMYEFAESLVKTHYPFLPRHKQLLFRYWHRLN